jgi:hypothetical protein
MNKETREKLEAIIRTEVENMPWKFRDVRAMYWYGITPYQEMTEEEINETFTEMELEVTDQDREWANY